MSVLRYLMARVPSSQHVRWMNQEEESGECYDLRIEDANGDASFYIEVSTCNNYVCLLISKYCCAVDVSLLV